MIFFTACEKSAERMTSLRSLVLNWVVSSESTPSKFAVVVASCECANPENVRRNSVRSRSVWVVFLRSKSILPLAWASPLLPMRKTLESSVKCASQFWPAEQLSKFEMLVTKPAAQKMSPMFTSPTNDADFSRLPWATRPSASAACEPGCDWLVLKKLAVSSADEACLAWKKSLVVKGTVAAVIWPLGAVRFARTSSGVR